MHVKSSLGEEEVLPKKRLIKQHNLPDQEVVENDINHANDVLRHINRLRDKGATDIVVTLTKDEAVRVKKTRPTEQEERHDTKDQGAASLPVRRIKVDFPPEVKITVGA